MLPSLATYHWPDIRAQKYDGRHGTFHYFILSSITFRISDARQSRVILQIKYIEKNAFLIAFTLTRRRHQKIKAISRARFIFDKAAQQTKGHDAFREMLSIFD
jgi:hypothetical protein